MTRVNITIDLARKLIEEQFPEFSDLPITDVEKQGHDNRTYRLAEPHIMEFWVTPRPIKMTLSILLKGEKHHRLMLAASTITFLHILKMNLLQC